jgi:hypothetical protein
MNLSSMFGPARKHFFAPLNFYRNLGSPVGIATGLKAQRPSFDSQNGQKIFLVSITSRVALGVQTASYPIGTEGCMPGG